MSSEVVSRRERKKQRTRQAIHIAAMDLVEAGGLGGVTIEAITDRADVAPRTFFNYYSSKEDAVLGHDPAELASLESKLRGRPAAEEPLFALQAVLGEELSARAAGRGDLERLIALIRSEPQLRAAQAAHWDQVEAALAAVVAERAGVDLEADLYPWLVVGVAVTAIRAAVRRWGRGHAPLMEAVGEAFSQLGAGLGQPLSAASGRPAGKIAAAG